MRDKENEVQHRILNINPKAYFVSCNANSLNLVANDATRCCLDAINVFDLYFSASTRHWDVLRSHVPSLVRKQDGRV